MTGEITDILRHPIKSHGREAVARATVEAGGTLPWDRVWAVAHSESNADGGAWAPCQNFSRGAKAAGLAAITSELDTEAGTITLHHPDLGSVTLDPDREGEKLIAWSASLIPENRAASARVIRCRQRGFTDSDFPSITLANHVSHRAVEQRIGRPLSIHRWRANVWCENLAPWEEFDWIDKEIRLGSAVVIPRERTDRCLATHANPETGRRDADILGALETWDHGDFTVRAEVVQGGSFAVGDSVGPV